MNPSVSTAVRLPRIAPGLYNGSSLRVRRAEPYLAVAAATLGDLDRRVAVLYLQVTGTQLLTSDSHTAYSGPLTVHELTQLPVRVAEARELAAVPRAATLDGRGTDFFDYAARVVADDAGPGADSLADIGFDLGMALRRHGVPASEAGRRRLLLLRLEHVLYTHIEWNIRPADSHRCSVELCQALWRLSPQTGVPLLLRPRVGAKKVPVEVLASEVGVSASAVRKWVSGESVPDARHRSALDQALDLPRGAVDGAAGDVVPEGWSLRLLDDART